MDENLDRRVFVAFDIETTGLQPIMNRTLELSAVKFTTSGRILGEFDELINPGIPIPEAASKVNKIYEEDIRNKSRATEILKGFSEFLDGCGSEVILLAHNSEFDVGFLGAEYILCNMEPPKVEIWDTLPMSRALVPNIMNHKLSTLVHHFDFRADGFHRALVDSYHVHYLFKWFCSQVNSLDELRELANPRYFDQSNELFSVQLPLPLMKLKKSLASNSRLRFVYEGETGIRETIEVVPHNLFHDEKYSYILATRETLGYPQAFRLDRLSRPEIVMESLN